MAVGSAFKKAGVWFSGANVVYMGFLGAAMSSETDQNHRIPLNETPGIIQYVETPPRTLEDIVEKFNAEIEGKFVVSETEASKAEREAQEALLEAEQEKRAEFWRQAEARMDAQEEAVREAEVAQAEEQARLQAEAAQAEEQARLQAEAAAQEAEQARAQEEEEALAQANEMQM